MLVYSNHEGQPYNMNIFYDDKEEYPFTMETINYSRQFGTIEEMILFMENESTVSKSGARMIEERIRTILSGCHHFPGRKCKGCEYASNPKEFDPVCMYGRDVEMMTVDECIDR